ncbi:MAG: phospho-N-acetylmuramoyl-pentapeptide-transferase [Deltaproteobacteria bacterium]|nr:phospho-N-acetylmuramoyl-pentapeptide-transferase [Candidatus Zymogenaceae bacterium]
MFYHLSQWLADSASFFNLFRYITFRTIYASLTALVICLVFGPMFIRKLRDLQVGQPIREDGPTSHFQKAGTPTMGGVLIVFSVVISTLLWADLSNLYIFMVLFVTISYAAIGFVDDYRKQIKKDSRGLPGRYKLLWQVIVGILVGVMLYMDPNFNTELSVPFLKNVTPDLGWFYIPFAIFVIVGTSNAVNLTDGLDGLAIGPVVSVAATYLVFAYVSGHIDFADYLLITFIPEAGELSVFCGTMVGAGIGFLWYNSHPAEIFMGDVGALSLGGAIGMVAVATKHELLLVIVGGLFVVETLSVIIQVGYFKLKKRRILKMAPLHHHFELLGWPEPKIIVRFWIISIMFALLAISTLKIR